MPPSSPSRWSTRWELLRTAWTCLPSTRSTSVASTPSPVPLTVRPTTLTSRLPLAPTKTASSRSSRNSRRLAPASTSSAALPLLVFPGIPRRSLIWTSSRTRRLPMEVSLPLTTLVSLTRPTVAVVSKSPRSPPTTNMAKRSLVSLTTRVRSRRGVRCTPDFEVCTTRTPASSTVTSSLFSRGTVATALTTSPNSRTFPTSSRSARDGHFVLFQDCSHRVTF
mmetsp:Transcript_31228/g.52639  ORF Transcript_31228/g.52639 Transcript_31228/m.52639 type:complete len:222 (-) Transcript_31228:694-1359(-)